MVLKLDPSNAEAWYDYGDTLGEMGMFFKALEVLEESIKLSPKFGPSHYSRGKVLLMLGDTEGAIESMKTAFEFEPELKELFKSEFPGFRRPFSRILKK